MLAPVEPDLVLVPHVVEAVEAGLPQTHVGELGLRQLLGGEGLDPVGRGEGDQDDNQGDGGQGHRALQGLVRVVPLVHDHGKAGGNLRRDPGRNFYKLIFLDLKIKLSLYMHLAKVQYSQ